MVFSSVCASVRFGRPRIDFSVHSWCGRQCLAFYAESSSSNPFPVREPISVILPAPVGASASAPKHLSRASIFHLGFDFDSVGPDLGLRECWSVLDPTPSPVVRFDFC
jgi:hypothetical protein